MGNCIRSKEEIHDEQSDLDVHGNENNNAQAIKYESQMRASQIEKNKKTVQEQQNQPNSENPTSQSQQQQEQKILKDNSNNTENGSKNQNIQQKPIEDENIKAAQAKYAEQLKNQQKNSEEALKLRQIELEYIEKQRNKKTIEKDNKKLENLYEKLVKKRTDMKVQFNPQKNIEDQDMFFDCLKIFRHNEEKQQQFFENKQFDKQSIKYLKICFSQFNEQYVSGLKANLQGSSVVGLELDFSMCQGAEEGLFIQLFQMEKSDFQYINLVFNNCFQVSDGLLGKLGSFLGKQKDLQVLVVKFQNCIKILDGNAVDFVQKGVSKQLRFVEVDFGGCKQISDKFLEEVGEIFIEIGNFKAVMWGCNVGFSGDKFLHKCNSKK